MQLFNFHISNFSLLLQKRLIVSGNPKCSQKLLISGNGKVSLGSNCSFGYKLGGHFYGGLIELQPRYENSVITIGNNVSANNNLFICCANQIDIGDFSLIGNSVSILDHEAHGIAPSERRSLGVIGSVIIGKNVWIGNDVLILKNTEIGDNSIVAAGAIVSGKFPANVIIGGIPAKVIKEINE